jgi:hypothetical protein
MIFSGVDNQTVELKITSYEFPGNQEENWEYDWLNIYLKVDSKVGKWQTVDPSLNTWEVQEIIDWFDLLSADKEPKYRLITFIEPNLSFELLNEAKNSDKLIRLRFDLECRPKSATDDKEYFVDISADKEGLIAIIRGLKDELSKYPERKPNA